MKVLHGIATLHPRDGGPARSVPALANATARAGAEVTICSREQATIDLSPFPDVTFCHGDVAQQVRDLQPDIIHDHGIWLPSNHSAVKAAGSVRIPLTISPRGMLEPWCLNHHRWRKRVAWYAYQKRDLNAATMLHATSMGEAETFRSLGFRQPIVIQPNGISLPAQPVESTPRKQANSQHQLVFVSRIHPVKGLKELLGAWATVRPPNWRLDIYGPAEEGHDDVIRRIINDEALTDSVAVHGPVDEAEKWSILQHADAAVLSSYSENFGIVVAEALAAGTPAITTTGTPWDRIIEKKCGWFVRPDALGLSMALNELTATPREELQAMGRRGREWMQAEFLWDSIGRHIVAAYQWLLVGQPASSCPEFVFCD